MNYKEEHDRLSKIAEEIKNSIDTTKPLDVENIRKLVPVLDSMLILKYLHDNKKEFSFKYITKKGNYADHYILNVFLDDNSKGFEVSRKEFKTILSRKPQRFRFSDPELPEHMTKLTLNPILEYLPEKFNCSCYYGVFEKDEYKNVVEFVDISDWVDWVDRDCDAIEPVISDSVQIFDECPKVGPPPYLDEPIEGRKAIPNAVGVDKQVKLKFEREKEELSKMKKRFEFLKDLDVNKDLKNLTPQQLMDFEYIYNVLFHQQWEHALLECKDFQYGVIMDSSQILVLEVEDEYDGGFIYQNVNEIVDNIQERQKNG